MSPSLLTSASAIKSSTSLSVNLLSPNSLKSQILVICIECLYREICCWSLKALCGLCKNYRWWWRYDAPMLVIKCLNDDDCMKPRPFLSRTLNAILTQKLPPPSVGRREETWSAPRRPPVSSWPPSSCRTRGTRSGPSSPCRTVTWSEQSRASNVGSRTKISQSHGLLNTVLNRRKNMVNIPALWIFADQIHVLSWVNTCLL